MTRRATEAAVGSGDGVIWRLAQRAGAIWRRRRSWNFLREAIQFR